MKQNHFAHCGDRTPPTAGEGPLAGKTIALHPSISVRNWPTEAGSRALEGFVALEDATAVHRLEAAGAVLAGTTAMNELGLGIDRDGAGPAVAEGQADMALLMDHMGEARIGAVRYALAGYKPSYGIISRFGLIGLIPSMECLGFMARDIADIREAVAAACGDDDVDYTLSPAMPDFKGAEDAPGRGRPVGIATEALALLDPGAGDTFRSALSHLEAAECQLHDASIPEFDIVATVHHIIGSVEASSSAGKFDGVRYGYRARGGRDWNEMYLRTRGTSFGTLLKSFLFQGAFYQFERYDAFETACLVRERLASSLEVFFDGLDFLILPAFRGASPQTGAASIAELYDLFRFTLPASLAGLPSVCLPIPVPGGKGSAPLQIVGRHLDDAKLLDFALHLSRHKEGTAS